MVAHKPDDPTCYVVFDGQCPFCARYATLIRLRDAVGDLQLVDARHPHPIVERLIADGYDLDEGMALVRHGQVSFGEDCVHQIALLSTSSGVFNRINAILFRRKTTAAVVYPVLRAGRNLTLRLLGRPSIADDRNRTATD
ncbi:MAG: DCC1-like thiol-disulfide oxidoreductase family protein [Pseudomonadota bacterium]